MTTSATPAAVGQPWLLVDPTYLQLILLVTEQCNFRCTYCYETFTHRGMPESVTRGVSRLLERRAAKGLRELELSWFGGEPLLEYETVLWLTRLARGLADEHDIRFRSDMTTNASLLTAPRLEELADSGCTRYQVTLDGTPAVHDLFRLTRSGRGTSEVVLTNLRGALATDAAFELLLRVHVHPGTADHLEELVELLRELQADRRVTLLIRPISNLGGPNADQIQVPDRDEFAEVLTRLRAALDGDRAHTASPFDDENDSTAACYAARANSFVIRSDGRVGKCTVALEDDRNTVGRITEDGAMVLDPERVRPWIRGVTSGDLEELECPLIGLPRLHAAG